MGKTACFAAALAITVSTATLAEAATQMRCSHQLPPSHHIAKVIDRWAAEESRNWWTARARWPDGSQIAWPAPVGWRS